MTDETLENPTSIDHWLTTLISEKGTDPSAPIPAFEDAGHIGLSYDHLIQFIKRIEPKTQQSIQHNLIKLDMANADVFDYLNHLLNGMILHLGLDAHGDLVKTKFGAF